ncbi:DNA-binding transcriptional LysR family regulator [Scopulibacillus darangshiensis]|uniref:DNA-binding transcriptional LysR family regulator n=1 Tax=Scopulibacillus darangshiensis TaxID=442528 RepID=A0A4R2NV36_9BACL|nr:LysR family transcriptional regulator [Scopulibacillus darangshiensis]TCP25969.1 DNA-binding transcriptional LysR family regulator [Scopulibacillus darangshiensis]
MELKQLKYFKTIVEAGNISKAAELLYMAQPPLSQQLKRLEKELDAVLIHRRTRQWELTEAGRALYKHAGYMLQKTADIKEEIQEINQGMRGNLTIGVSTSCISYLPKSIKTFRATHPNVYLKIWEGDSYYLEELLSDGKIEVALMLLPKQLEEYELIQLQKEPFVAAVPKSLGEQFTEEVIGLKQIAEYPFLMLAPMEGYSMYEDIIHHFHKSKLAPDIVMECKDISILLALVASGVGISIIPKSEIHEAYHHDITTFEINDFSVYVEPSIIWRKNHRLTKAAEYFMNHLIKK